MPLPDPPWGNDGTWSSVAFDDKECPGLAHVNVSRANKWDTKKAQGSHGAERAFKGSDLASVKIQIRQWTIEQFEGFIADHLPTLEPDPGKKKPSIIVIGNGVAAARHVSKITVDNVSGPDQDPAGWVTWDIDATEHREPDSTNAKGTGTGGVRKDCLSLQLAREQALNEYHIYSALFSEAINPFSPNFNPNKAAEYSGRMDGAKAAAQIHDITMQAIGCNQAPPGGFLEPGVIA